MGGGLCFFTVLRWSTRKWEEPVRQHKLLNLFVVDAGSAAKKNIYLSVSVYALVIGPRAELVIY
jgi:hypothetical protein